MYCMQLVSVCVCCVSQKTTKQLKVGPIFNQKQVLSLCSSYPSRFYSLS